MIGVVADSANSEVVQEFFELFKTPWEFYCSDREYDVLVCDGNREFNARAKLVILYAGKKTTFDDEREITISQERKDPCIVTDSQDQLALYGESLTFASKTSVLLTDEASQECVGFLETSGERVLARIGYDLFEEVRTLLTKGQPSANAMIPTLELHIALLRNIITAAGIELFEIPPIPQGFSFIACLTHDVDHPSIRAHKFDHTMFGFVYRASFGSLLRFLRRQIPLRVLLANWAALVKLPLIYLDLANDLWREFAKRYLQIEKGVGSTFFIIPFRNQAGRTADGVAPGFRAAGYGAQDIADIVQRLRSAGHEIGLHGIDAWIDDSKAREELKAVQGLTGAAETGVRMHWLYFDQKSPAVLEKAGADYDSTCGYNHAVGYRAGTTQVFKPFGVNRLLELPMHAMDTALFYPTRMQLSADRANITLRQMADNVERYGGVLTVNWHDRSVVPERLWDTCYRDLLADFKRRGAWCCSAGECVAWFRKRRAVRFETDRSGLIVLRNNTDGDRTGMSGLRLRTHRARAGSLHADYVDIPVDDEGIEASFSSGYGA